MVKSGLSKNTVAELRDLCKGHGLAISGKKSVLIERLEKAGHVDNSMVGSAKSRLSDLKVEMGDDDDALILEDDTSVSSDDVIEADIVEGEVLEAEVIEADIVADDVMAAEVVEVEEKEPLEIDELAPIPTTKKLSAMKPPTIEKTRRKVSARKYSAKTSPSKMPIKRKIMATSIVFFLLAMTGWWYFTGTIEPFTPDPIRYGDSMHYSISDGLFTAEGEYVEKAIEAFDSDEDDICRITLAFSGTGDISVTNGGESQLAGQSNNDLLGVVNQRGSYGDNWLTVEKEFEQDYDDVTITRFKNNIIDSSKCNDGGASVFGNTLELKTTTWTELRSEDLLRSQIDYQVQLESSAYEGSITTFGLSGIFSSLGSLQSSISMAFAPVELQELIGDTLIEDGSSGSRMGWSWRVVSSEEKDGEMAWRIFMESEEIKKYCLGHAHITIWAQADSPWAAHQEVDIFISGDTNQDTCDTTSQLINDFIVPEGTLEMRMKMQRSSIERGEKAVVFGRDYPTRPRSSDLKPEPSELSDWGDEGTHLPDLSNRRLHTLEMAVDCVEYLEGASGAKAALSGEGYVWRAVDDREQQDTTEWNLSWVDSDGMSGWVRIAISGENASSENCTYLGAGAYEDGPSHDRNDIPESLTLAAMESRLLDSNRYPELTTGLEYLGTSSAMHDSVHYGHLITTAGSNFEQIAQWLDLDDGAGAATVDFRRTWDQEQWSNTFTLAADASDGRVVGWSFVRST
jgi:hypothetical protein